MVSEPEPTAPTHNVAATSVATNIDVRRRTLFARNPTSSITPASELVPSRYASNGAASLRHGPNGPNGPPAAGTFRERLSRGYAGMKQTVPSGTCIGLVLGAGGTVGCAYHAGVLYSLLHHLD